MKKLVAPGPAETGASNSANAVHGQTTLSEMHTGNVVSQGKSEDVKMGERPNDDSQTDTSSSTSSLSDSDSSSSSDSDSD